MVRVDRTDGSSVCDHTDGTRITKYCREVEQEENGKMVKCLMLMKLVKKIVLDFTHSVGS